MHSTPQQVQPRTDAGSTTEIVWQWICYALWGWTLFALSVFLSATLTYFLVKESAMHEVSAYSFAAVLVLFPMAFFVDRIYREREPAEKRGFAAVVLVLNALFVFLAFVAGVLATVVSLFWLVIHADVSPTMGTSILSSVVVTLLGGMLFARIVGFARIARYVKLFPLIVAGVVAVTSVLALAGPVRSMVATRSDRLIEDNLITVDTAIQDYATDNAKLPESLSDLSLKEPHQEGAKKLVDRKLVTYTPDTDSASSYNMNYELCVTFSKAKGNGSTANNDTYGVASNHGKGKQCYSLSAYGDVNDTDDSSLDDYYNSSEYKQLMEGLDANYQ